VPSRSQRCAAALLAGGASGEAGGPGAGPGSEGCGDFWARGGGGSGEAAAAAAAAGAAGTTYNIRHLI
jgi:hypothetical protein